ncbi:MAG: hypothetical protein HYZ10_13890 [Ignavibacteriales bacterium]|nr:hypothetical protein [Ignavibacteriales bacterium]
MKKIIVLFSFIVILISCTGGTQTTGTKALDTQTIGAIFDKAEANKLFDNVIESVKMNRTELDLILSQTNNYVMFNVNNGELTILGDGRKVLYPAGKVINSTDVFYVASKSKVIELLNLGSGTDIFFERRPKVVSITKDMNTLEDVQPCPPDCY